MSPIDALINQLQQSAENQGLPAGFAQFLQYYYEDADIDDLNHYPLPQLLAGALSHYHFANEPRQRGQARLRCLQQDRSSLCPRQYGGRNRHRRHAFFD